MITADGWLDWAVRMPGPSDKIYSQPCQSMGYVPHSAVGYLAGWLSRLFSTDRQPGGRYTDYAAASVTGFIRYTGVVIQHYPLGVSCWASGNRHANVKFNAFENEGGWLDHDEPLTVPQIEANGRVVRDMVAWKGWTPRRPVGRADKYASLYEHHECVELWGGAPTACPSGRMPWDIFEEEMDVLLREQVAQLEADLGKTDAAVKWQGGLIGGLYNGNTKFIIPGLHNHERRLVKLGSQPSDGEPG